MEILDGDHRKWFSGQPMPKKLAGHCAIRDWDAIYVIGTPESSKSGDLEIFLFNITTTTWKILPFHRHHVCPKKSMDPSV